MHMQVTLALVNPIGNRVVITYMVTVSDTHGKTTATECDISTWYLHTHAPVCVCRLVSKCATITVCMQQCNMHTVIDTMS